MTHVRAEAEKNISSAAANENECDKIYPQKRN